MDSFSLAAAPKVYFGPGKISVLTSTIKPIGSNILLVTGKHSFINSPQGKATLEQLRSGGISVNQISIDKEPTPQMIDAVVNQYANDNPDVVVAVGGGSVMDAGKAMSAMLPIGEPVKDYLEGVGTKEHPGIKIPFIAIPTTAGTGSESTKNAVLSETGEHGYKRSLRHDKFVPDMAIIDPELTVSCSPLTTATSGMDAFTQLLESFLSTQSNPLTNALATEGLRCIADSLMKAYREPTDLYARTDMALGAYLSGMALANAGLGLVHGFAASIGGYFDISHGAICSALMAPVNRVTVKKLRRTHNNDEALTKYAHVGKLFSQEEDQSDEYYTDFLLDMITRWTMQMKIPTLASGGIAEQDFDKIVAATGNKYNPVPLDTEEMLEVLEMTL